MKQLLLLLPLTFLSIPVQAQQVNQFAVCTQNREIYRPGGVTVQTYNVPCNSGNQYYSNANTSGGCRAAPTILGALLGGGVAASMSRGDGYAWSVPVGAAIGGALFGCN